MIEWALWLVAGYLAGSIPVGYLLARSRGIDIRKHGSGNIGATNVGRILGPRLGRLCLAIDMAKGLLPALAFGFVSGAIERFASLSAAESGRWLGVAACTIAGHMFPAWLGFRGGKGVATGFGALLGIVPILALPVIGALVAWLISAKLTRMVGISSCIAAASLPCWLILGGLLARQFGAYPDPPRALFGALWPFLAASSALALLVIWRHRANIARTLAGTEHRIGEPAPPPPAGHGS